MSESKSFYRRKMLDGKSVFSRYNGRRYQKVIRFPEGVQIKQGTLPIALTQKAAEGAVIGIYEWNAEWNRALSELHQSSNPRIPKLKGQVMEWTTNGVFTRIIVTNHPATKHDQYLTVNVTDPKSPRIAMVRIPDMRIILNNETLKCQKPTSPCK